MEKLDFLSGAPKLFLFEKRAKENVFGGFLTIIYLIVVILIATLYIYDYTTNSKYSIIFTNELEILTDVESILKKEEDRNFNPMIEFNVRINVKNESNFVLLSGTEILNFGVNYQIPAKEIAFAIAYKCAENGQNDTNNTCKIREEDKNFLNGINIYSIQFNYTGCKIDHQNSKIPLEKTYIKNVYFSSFNITDDRIMIYSINWKTIKYEEEKDIFEKYLTKKSEVLYGGEFVIESMFEAELSQVYKDFAKEKGYKSLCIFINLQRNKYYYDSYVRTKKGIFDIISDICSLTLTFYSIFIFILDTFFSDNFNNYSIIDEILKIKEQDKIIRSRNRNTSKIAELNENSKANDNINKDNTENIIYNVKGRINIDEINSIDKIVEKKNTQSFPKLHFYDFLASNFYFRKCCLSKKQELISLCNDIVSKYYSIDKIIYNQIKLENLFKDYNWNNPDLNTIKNNKMIYGIKSYI